MIVRDGLEGASMSAIAVEAGMSKRTLYEVFGNRADLFAAIVRRIRNTVTHELDESERLLPLEQRLRLLLLPSIDKQPDSVPAAILRAVVAEAKRQPELAKEFLQEGPKALRNIIRDELDRAVECGETRIADTAMAAELLASMAFGDPLTHLIDPSAGHISPKERKKRLDKAIDIFLHGVGG
ncbi:MAG: TetR/AcrR family transcriptional regulator [Nitratireductor sp.]|nr:TetR/AcrR family transcriptional regulator [Nitratireductor sp.]